MSNDDAINSSAADCNKLGILVEEAEHASWGQTRTYRRHIYMAATSGDWVKASSYDKTHPNWTFIPLTTGGDTALHVAVSMEQTDFVAKLVERMSIQDMEIQMADGNTAFCMAAISGNVKIATVLFRKNPGLVWIRGHKEMLPIQLASSAGHPHMVEFLFEKTRVDLHINIPFQDIVRLFFLTITNSIYTVAWNLLNRYPELASKENEEGQTALQVLAQLSFYEDARGYRDLLSSLFKVMEEEELNIARTSKAMFDAAKSGNIMILEYILKYNPNLLMEVNSNGQSLLHIAILYRQMTVYRLILSKGVYKNVIVQLVDYDGNNVLHLAGKLAAEGRFGSPIHQLLIRSEELWFQELEKIVPPALKTMENRQGWTPKELFYKEHIELSEKAVSEQNGRANIFLVIATLIITLGITGALTIRTNEIDPGAQSQTPFLQREIWYIIFLLSVAVGVSFTAVSMLLFTSVILPSIGKSKHGYVGFRMIRMMCGYLLLYASVGIMGAISVPSGAILVFTFFPKWVFYVIAALGGIPCIMSVVIYYHPLHLALHLIKRLW